MQLVGEIHDRMSRDAVASSRLVRAGSLAGDRVVKPSRFEPDRLVREDKRSSPGIDRAG